MYIAIDVPNFCFLIEVLWYGSRMTICTCFVIEAYIDVWILFPAILWYGATPYATCIYDVMMIYEGLHIYIYAMMERLQI